MRFILHIALTALALWVTTRFAPGLRVEGGGYEWFLVAAVFGLVNALVKPLVEALAMPALFLTLGLFLVVINAGMLLLTAYLVPSLQVATLQDAVVGGTIVAVVSWVLHLLFGRG